MGSELRISMYCIVEGQTPEKAKTSPTQTNGYTVSVKFSTSTLISVRIYPDVFTSCDEASARLMGVHTEGNLSSVRNAAWPEQVVKSL
jgi:hypothetical protein